MSVKLWKLNGDATFLLSFYESPLAHQDSEPCFTILVDPWLEGGAETFHQKFSCSSLAIPPAVTSLAEISPPDLVLISQDKTDHCNEDTLCKLDPANDTEIYAAQSGSAIIKSWNFFRKEKVHALKDWDRRGKKDNVLHIPVFSKQNSLSKVPGNIDVFLIPSPVSDMSNLHTAIALIYHPPLRRSLPPTPPASPSTATESIAPISILISPHGLLSVKSITPFAGYLESISASPLTLLMHCFDAVKNPRILGGIVSSGSSMGIEVARRLKARYWVSLHDEEKLVSGIATNWVKISKSSSEVLEKTLNSTTKIVEVPCGGTWTFSG